MSKRSKTILFNFTSASITISSSLSLRACILVDACVLVKSKKNSIIS